MTSQSPPNFETRVSQYVRLRDLIKEMKDRHKEELKKPTETLEKLNLVMLTHLNAISADSVATAYGTVSKTTKKSASIADMSAFWTYVVTQGDFDMVDKKANPTRVEEYINANGGQLPPGVNFSQVELVGVRRKSGT